MPLSELERVVDHQRTMIQNVDLASIGILDLRRTEDGYEVPDPDGGPSTLGLETHRDFRTKADFVYRVLEIARYYTFAGMDTAEAAQFNYDQYPTISKLVGKLTPPNFAGGIE